jgi:hypothetical protein
VITNLPPEAAEAMEESARQMSLNTGLPYEDCLARLVSVLEAFSRSKRVEVWMRPRGGGCEHRHVLFP